MKLYVLPLLFFVTILSSCNGQSSAYSKAKETEKAIKDAPRPGTVPTSNGGWTLTAKVDGKPWTASSIMPPAKAGSIVGYIGEQSYLGVPSFDKRYAKVGKKKVIGDSHSADMWFKGDETFYNKHEGTIEITKVNGDWVEGTFSFTGTSDNTGKKMVVSDGFFRVQL